MRQRFYDRIAALLSIALLAGLAGFSYYLAELAEQLDRRQQGVRGPVHEPDYFVEGFAMTRTNRAGAPTFRMSAARMEHFPDDDSSAFTRPVLVSLDPERPLVTLRADRGQASSGGQQTQLFDHVVLTRAGQGGKPELRVETDYVLLLPEDDIARTHRPVKITQGGSSLTGVGMEFNNAARLLQVRSKVQGVWAAPEQR